MEISQLIGLKDKEIVSIVGAGGKTTTMFRLARERIAQGKRVVTATTTMIALPEPGDTESLLVSRDRAEILRNLQTLLQSHRQVTVAGFYTDDGTKLKGIPPELVAEIAALPEVDNVMVEADGAKGKMIKAPALYEPVVPTATNVLIPVVSLEAVGRTLDDETAHRIESVASLAEMRPGETLTPERIAAVLTHPEGGLKQGPSCARVWPLITKVTPERRVLAHQLARRILQSERISGVLAATLQDAWAIDRSVSAIILAGGASRRYGEPKQLLTLEGKTLLEHVVENASASKVGEVIVVLGYQAETIRSVLEGYPVKLVISDNWDRGQSASLQIGLQAVSPVSQAAVFLLVDQPKIDYRVIDRVIDDFRYGGAPIVVPSFDGKWGNPVLFSRRFFPELMALVGDQGGRIVAKRHRDSVHVVPVDSAAILSDIDTPEDYLALRRGDH